MVDYLKYFDREQYLFEDVHSRFLSDHCLGAFDFFSIVIWKANRAKSKIARRLLKEGRKGKCELEARCRALTKLLDNASDRKERLRLLIKEWGFHCPWHLRFWLFVSLKSSRDLYGKSNAIQLEKDIQLSFNLSVE